LYAVELENISKTFPGDVQANKDITLRVKEGEVHGLLGENGAGKSTLMNILYGLLDPTSGTIKIRGEKVTLKSPDDAINRGVGMVHQHFKLIPPLTVTENIIIGMEPRRKRPTLGSFFILLLSLVYFAAMVLNIFPLEIQIEGEIIPYYGPLIFTILFIAIILILFFGYDRIGGLMGRLGPLGRFFIRLGSPIKKLMDGITPIGFSNADEKIRKIAKENGLTIDPTAKIADLSVGLQQRVEIIKTLYREAEILILDEPTSVLTPQEVDELFETLKAFRDSGKTIILITHKLRETMALCDRISVLRDGELVGTVNRDETSREELAQMMVGRPVVFTVEKPPAHPGETILSVDHLVAKDHRGLLAVKGVDLDVRAGEILGIAGVEGNGQTELVEALTGLNRPLAGRVCLNFDPSIKLEERFLGKVWKNDLVKYISHGILQSTYWILPLLIAIILSIALTGITYLIVMVLIISAISYVAGSLNVTISDVIWRIQCRKTRRSKFIHGLFVMGISTIFTVPFLIIELILEFQISFDIIDIAFRIFIPSIFIGYFSKRIALIFQREELLGIQIEVQDCAQDMLDITGIKPRMVRRVGVSHIPEDRHKRGLVLSFTLEENLVLGQHYIKPFARGKGLPVLNLRTIEDVSDSLISEYSIKTAGGGSLANTLSGGNQQKVVVAREIASHPRLLIAAQPTRGLDVGATEFIHRTLIRLRDEGVAILLVSAELDEIRTLSDRIAVIYDGQIVGERRPEETDAQELGLMMAGATVESEVIQ
jgi:ABC-type uncharacterized transport system ATPase subunit